MNPDEEKSVHINLGTGFQLMYDLETVVHINVDSFVQFIRKLPGLAVIGMANGVWGVKNVPFGLLDEGCI